MKIFEKPGPENTEDTLKIALEAAYFQDIQTIVVASNSGETVEKLLAMGTDGIKIVCVTHVCGFRAPGEMEMPQEEQEKLKKAGVRIVTAAHALSGADRAFSKQFQGVSRTEIVAYTLRMFGQGTKVCAEISLMAADCGAVEYGRQLIAIGGTGRGADTAVVLRPANTADLLNLKIDEMLCKPYVKLM